MTSLADQRYTTPYGRLVMVGACYIDTILTTPHYPSEDDKLRASSITRRRGGNCANSLEVLQHRTSSLPSTGLNSLALLCVLPDRSSQATQFITSSYTSQVDLSHCIYRNQHVEAASSYIIKSIATGSRTIVNYNELPEMSIDEFQQAVLGLANRKGRNERSWFHFEGRETTTALRCIRWLRERYPTFGISVEVEKPKRPGLLDMAADADIVFFSKTWAQHEGYKSHRECLLEQAKHLKRAAMLCCTWGEAGAAFTQPSSSDDNNDPLICQSESQLPDGAQVVDTIGAGDTFIACLLFQLLSGDSSDIRNFKQQSNAFLHANNMAGRKVLREGFAHVYGEP